MKARFQSMIKLNYRMLLSCFDYIPLSFERTDLKTLLQSRKIKAGFLRLEIWDFAFWVYYWNKRRIMTFIRGRHLNE